MIVVVERKWKRAECPSLWARATISIARATIVLAKDRYLSQTDGAISTQKARDEMETLTRQ